MGKVLGLRVEGKEGCEHDDFLTFLPPSLLHSQSPFTSAEFGHALKEVDEGGERRGRKREPMKHFTHWP